MSLLEKDSTRKQRVDENMTDFQAGNNKEYELEKIWNNAVYIKELAVGDLSSLYYLISWKRYPKKENSWELLSIVKHLWKLLSAFHKDNPDKPTITSLSVNIALSMAWSRSEPTKAAK